MSKFSSLKPAVYAAWQPVDAGPQVPLLPLSPRRGVLRQRPGVIALDLGAPGLVSVTATLATQGVLVAPVLALGTVGVASLGFDDWGLGLRIMLGVVGILACLISAAAIIWPFIFACGWRERVLIAGGQLTVEAGVGPWRRVCRLGAVCDIEVSVVEPPRTLRRRLFFPNYMGCLDGRCLSLKDRTSGRVAIVGTWLDKALVGMARDVVVRAKGVEAGPLTQTPTLLIGPLGWSGPRIGAALGRWVHKTRRDPAPVLFDVAVTLGFMLVSAIPEVFAVTRAAYPVLGVALFAGLAVQFRRPAAVLGLVPHPRSLETPFILAMGGLGVVIGLAAGPMAVAWFEGGAPRLELVSLGLSLALGFGAAVVVGKRALKTGRGLGPALPALAATRAAEAVVTIALIGLTWVHESWAWAFVTDAQKGLGPLSVAMTPVVAGLLIWPARFLFVLRTPFDDGPRWAFVGVIASLVLLSLTGWI